MTTAYPLAWPAGWPRTPAELRRSPGATFGHNVTLEKARKRLFEELRLMGAADCILSTNIPLRQDGFPRSDFARYRIDDEGVAVYFTRDGQRLCMAHDAWNRVETNVNALALAIAGMRQMERHGGAHMMKRAFTGFAALPAPGSSRRPWHEVLKCHPGASADSIQQSYRVLARTHHPDLGGDPALMAEINAAYEQAKQLGLAS